MVNKIVLYSSFIMIGCDSFEAVWYFWTFYMLSSQFMVYLTVSCSFGDRLIDITPLLLCNHNTRQTSGFDSLICLVKRNISFQSERANVFGLWNSCALGTSVAQVAAVLPGYGCWSQGQVASADVLENTWCLDNISLCFNFWSYYGAIL